MKNKKINNLLKNKNNLFIVIAIFAILVFAVAFLLIINGKNSNKENSNDKKISLKDALTKNAKDFYENNYYNGLDDKSKLANFTQNGININISNLDSIVRLNDVTRELLEEKNCDYENSKVYIFPEEPFEVNNYKVKVELSCEK